MPEATTRQNRPSGRWDPRRRRHHVCQGGDNIAIYTPVFRTMSGLQAATTIIVFLVLVAIWCGIGRLVGTHPAVVEGLEKVEGWLVPAVFIGLGLYILIDSGTLAHLLP